MQVREARLEAKDVFCGSGIRYDTRGVSWATLNKALRNGRADYFLNCFENAKN